MKMGMTMRMQSLTCNHQKPTGSQFSLLHEPNHKVNGKPLSSPESVNAVRWKGLGLWWEGFQDCQYKIRTCGARKRTAVGLYRHWL